MADGMSLTAVVENALAEVPAPGVVVALSSPDGVRSIAAGTVELGSSSAVSSDHWFEIGSVTKVMTATLVMQLVQDGALSIDDRVCDHVPEFRLATDADTQAIRVRHLLTHTSGIDAADDFTDTGTGDDCLTRFVGDVIQGAGMLHAPGVRWSYSNAGFSILGRLVETVTGDTWDQAMKRSVFDRCGMDAATTRTRGDAAPMVTGHRFDFDSGEIVIEKRLMPASAGPAGNVVTTAESLVRFAEAAIATDSPLLASGTRDLMCRPEITVRDAQQALGWYLPNAPVRVGIHGGQTTGFTAFIAVLIDMGTAMAVLANGPGAGVIALRLQQHLFGQPPPPQPETVTIDDDKLDAVCGTYIRRHVSQEVTRVDGGLKGSTNFTGPLADLFPQPTCQLRPVGDYSFVGDLPDGTGTQLWDFTGSERGRPLNLFTTRVHRRA